MCFVICIVIIYIFTPQTLKLYIMNYFLIEDSLSGLTIINKFNNLKEAEEEKFKMECGEGGKWCGYFITELTDLTNKDA